MSSHIPYAKETLKLEADAVNRLIELVDESFDKAVEVILAMSSEGRVVVSGMGKAGFIGMKISATLASTGVPSYFLHPAEAVHGDLGRYTKEDVALLLSNSGETDEILRILPQIKRMGCPIISITSDGDSGLSKRSEVVLSIGRIEEAGPLGLAPTTSTTVMLALGDALAMSVLKAKGLTREEYAQFHPAGALGRSLMQISEIMRTKDEFCTVPDTVTVREALQAITATTVRCGSATIVDSDGRLSGIYTLGDLKRCLAKGDRFLDRPINELMTVSPKSVKPNQLVSEARSVMMEYQIDELIVLDDENRPVGLIDVQDIVRL